MAQIFLSYSTKSKAQVETLDRDLREAGHEVWFDHKLTGGQAWWNQIVTQIFECDLFVFALTPEALDSVACQREYGYAHSLHKNILPILVADNVPIAQLPPELSEIQFVDYRAQERTAGIKLMNALNHLPAPRPLPDPLPEAPLVPLSYLGSMREQIDSAKPLTGDEQKILMFNLNQYIKEHGHNEDVLSLLHRLKQREDLLARIDKEIEVMLLSAAPPAAAPPAVAKPKLRAALPKAQPKIDIPPADSVSVQPDERKSLRDSIGVLVRYVIATGVVWGGVYGFVAALVGPSEIYANKLLFIATVVGMILLHGIVSGFVLRPLEPLPRESLSLSWIFKPALMGGPLNGFLLRRIVPVRASEIVLIAFGWLVCIVATLVVFATPMLEGLIAGLVAGLGTTIVLALMWRSR